MKFGSPRYARDLHEFREWSVLAESLGLDVIGYGDSSTLWIDPFVALTTVAEHTNRIRLVTTVTNPVTRHPAVMASAFSGLQQVSRGRAVMGIGAGDSALLNLGLDPPNASSLELYVSCFNALTSGADASYQGKLVRLEWQVERTPVWIAANGPRTLRLAGRIADGVITHLGTDEASVREAIRHVHAGAREAGRDPASIEIWWMVQPLISAAAETGWKELRFALAGIANHVFRSTFTGKAVPPEFHDGLLALQREYRPDQHADPAFAEGHNAQLVDRYGLLEFLGRRFTVCGPPDYIAATFNAMAGWGADRLLLIQVVDDRISALRQFAEQVFPLVAGW
jgi:5,10-methylenetetrahydromethanopterin reductase